MDRRTVASLALALSLLGMAVDRLIAGNVVIRKTSKAEMDLSEAPLPAYTVRAPTYSVEVFPDGRFRLTAGKITLFKGLSLDLEGKAFPLTDIRPLGAGELGLGEGLPVKEKPAGGDEAEPEDGEGTGLGVAAPTVEAPNLPTIVLKFLEDRIEMRYAGLKVYRTTQPQQLPAAYNCRGAFGDDAVGVRNLRTEAEDALPSQRLCTRHIFSAGGWYGPYWPDVEVTYADGLRMEIRGIMGISHGRIGEADPASADPAKALRGYWALHDLNKDSRVSFVIRPAEKPDPVTPAPYCTVSSNKPKNFFLEDEPVLFRLHFAREYLVPAKWQVSWAVEDHAQRPVTEGTQELVLDDSKEPQMTVNLAPAQMGYLRARLKVARADGVRSAHRTHEVTFARVRLEPAARKFLPKASHGGDEMEWSNVLGLRGIRLCLFLGDIRDAHPTPEGNIDWESWTKSFGAFMNTAREGTLKGFFCLMDLSSKNMDKEFKGLYPDPEERQIRMRDAQLRWLGEWAREAKKCGLEIWEPINEPNLGMSPEGYLQGILKAQYPIVKAANPTANFLGGSICGLDNYGWVRRLFEIGGGPYFDGVSFHPYTGLGFQEVYRTELDRWWQIFRDHKAENRGLWMTESAWHRGWSVNEYMVHRFNGARETQARNAVLMILNAEAMRIPRDRVYVFYLVEHGYNEFFLLAYQSPTTAAISLQVMNECLRDAPFEKEIPLPGRGRHFQVYRDETRTVAVAMTGDEPADLDFSTDAAEVVVTDMMGNRKAIRPEGGKARIGISGDPTYLVVGPNQSLRPSYGNLEVQPNLALSTLGAMALASSPQPTAGSDPAGDGPPPLNPGAAVCGDWTSHAGPRVFGQWWGWQEDEAGKSTWPDWLEVKLPQPAPIARVRVCHEYGGWARTLRDYDLQAFVSGDWKTVDQVRGNVYRNIHDHRFDPVTTDRVRVLVHMVTVPQDWLSKVSSARAIEVYSPAEGPAKAFFIQDIPRQRILSPGESVEWNVRIQGTTKARVAGEVRLRLPPNLTAEPVAQALSLDPEGTAECTFRIRTQPEAKDGIYTAVAGLYEGDRLVSSDSEPCVVCVKRPPKPKDGTEPPKKDGPAKQDEKPKEDAKKKDGKPKKTELEALDEPGDADGAARGEDHP